MFLEALVATGPDAVLGQVTALTMTQDWISAITPVLALVGFIGSTIWSAYAAKGNAVISAVNEVKSGTELTGDQAKALAVSLFKKYLPFLPPLIADAFANWFIQFLFDRMKDLANANARKAAVMTSTGSTKP